MGRELDARIAEEVFNWKWLAYERTHEVKGAGSTFVQAKVLVPPYIHEGRERWGLYPLDEVGDHSNYPSYIDGEIRRIPEVPHYSTDIEDGFEVAEEINLFEGTYHFHRHHLDWRDETGWAVCIIGYDGACEKSFVDDHVAGAICKAARYEVNDE